MGPDKATASSPLTTKLIEAAKPQERDFELADTGDYRGLRLRVLPNGGKVFRWYVTSIKRVITIGYWSKVPKAGFVTLGEAHTWLERLKAAYKAGELDKVEAELRALRKVGKPASARNAATPPTPPKDALTLNEVAADFFKFIGRRRKHPGEVKRSLEKDVLPYLGTRPVAAITPREIREVVERVIEVRKSRSQAGKVLAQVKQLYRFACGRDEVAVAANPAYPLEAEALGVENNEGQRTLTDEEIGAFWDALGASKMTPTVRAGLKFLLLTGVRSCELLRAKWTDINRDEDKSKWEKGQTHPRPTWTIPVANQKLTMRQEKKAKPWVVPLTPPMMAILDQLKAMGEGSEWIMASPLADDGRITEKALNAAMRKLFEGTEPLLKFDGERPTPHDLRRTVRSGLPRLGVNKDVAERCLNHRLPNMEQIYNRYDYLPERREAMEAWGALVDRLVDPSKPSNVAFIADRRA